MLSIPYAPAELDFAAFAQEPGSFFLDSSRVDPKYGRYSFWGINPLQTFTAEAGLVTWNGAKTIASPLERLREFYQTIQNLPHDPYLPFRGGLVGFFGYEFGAALENIEPAVGNDPLALADCSLGLYDTVVCYDHLEQSCRVASLGLDPDSQMNAENLAKDIIAGRKTAIPPQRRGDYLPPPLLTKEGRKTYLDAIRKIQKYLQTGDCYQVNLSQRFSVPAYDSSWEIYRRLRKISPAPYAAYLNFGSQQILSSSPECFLIADADGHLLTKPIKGTRPRGQTDMEDIKLKRELAGSEKEQAELLMITDLLRNDLGRVALPGSVQVPQLREIESFAQVHHLVSTITAQRKPEYDIIDCLRAMLPGGSITGAPKIRAMEIIRELEPANRGVYTGAIGWLGPANTAHLNIAIRTMVIQEGIATFSAGGGITIDSDPEAEYEETLTKAKGMIEALHYASLDQR